MSIPVEQEFRTLTEEDGVATYGKMKILSGKMYTTLVECSKCGSRLQNQSYFGEETAKATLEFTAEENGWCRLPNGDWVCGGAHEENSQVSGREDTQVGELG